MHCSMMKIILINVRCDFTANIPRGVLQIAAILEKAGYEVKVIDPLYAPISYSFIKKFEPDIVGISFMSLNYKSAKNVVLKLRKTVPQAILIGGGVHPTVKPEDTLKEIDLDYIVIGEGEVTMLNLLEYIKDPKRNGITNIKGIGYKNKKGKININETAEFVENLDKLPFPARNLINMGNYLVHPGYIRSYIMNRVGTIYSSRGCPGRCTFCCSYVTYKGKYRQRNVDDVISEVKLLIKKYDINGLYFNDETFIYNKDWVAEFCRKINKFNLSWGLATRVSLVDYDLLKLMKESGCKQIDYGVESGSDRILKLLKKGTNRKIIENTFKITRRAGIRTFGTVMVGNPTETEEDIDLTISLLKKIKPDFILSSFFVPLPGTECYNDAVSSKKINKNFYKNEDYHFVLGEKPIVNLSGMSDSELIRSKVRIDNVVFLRNYLSLVNLHNLYFIFRVILAACLNLKDNILQLKSFLQNRRSDQFIGYLLKNYQIHHFNK